MNTVWSARTGAGAAYAFQAYSESTAEDQVFVPFDAQGSIAHVAGLHHVGLLDTVSATSLIEGIQALAHAHQAGTWILDPALEDVHMNFESALTDRLGEPGQRLHTGRSRNDQVATCLVLHARDGLADLADMAHQIAATLAHHAADHAATPWVARTHAQPAQPATLGFLLHAHALRFAKLAETALAAFETLGESPLGCGAVAGSTLPLDPAYTAQLMALRPPQNALLATGSRPTVLAATEVSAQVGLIAASLAQDLMDLFAANGLTLASGHTTGSSLMPQKRNPDALELVRGVGKALTQAPAQAYALIAGLGLGYQRDLQATKPLQVQALRDAAQTLGVLREIVEGLSFDPEPFQVSFESPGITATDMAEALVSHGVPFRTAYTALATAFARVEQGQSLEQALCEVLSPEEAQIALTTATPDPARRDTLAGPAPRRVQEAILELRLRLQAQATVIQATHATVNVPLGLLAAAPADLLEVVTA